MASEKNKTAMQQLIEEMEGAPLMLMDRMGFLEKEKQRIFEAYKSAITIDLCEQSQNREAEEYYCETYSK